MRKVSVIKRVPQGAVVQIYGRRVAIAERLMVSRSVVLTKFVMEEPPFGIRRPEFAAAADDLNIFC